MDVDDDDLYIPGLYPPQPTQSHPVQTQESQPHESINRAFVDDDDDDIELFDDDNDDRLSFARSFRSVLASPILIISS